MTFVFGLYIGVIRSMNYEKSYLSSKAKFVKTDFSKLKKSTSISRKGKVFIFAGILSVVSLANFYDRLDYDQGKWLVFL